MVCDGLRCLKHLKIAGISLVISHRVAGPVATCQHFQDRCYNWPLSANLKTDSIVLTSGCDTAPFAWRLDI